MKIAIVYASRYGSTAEAAGWIAQRLSLDGLDATVLPPNSVGSVDDYDVLILGSGLYGHKLLPELDEFIDRNIEQLKSKKLAVFALAMKREPIFVQGQVHGGLNHLEYIFEKLGASVIHADMLPGEMAFARLNEKDKKGLDGFYKMIKLDEAEIKERKRPRTLMNKADYWEFAETIIRKLAETGGEK